MFLAVAMTTCWPKSRCKRRDRKSHFSSLSSKSSDDGKKTLDLIFNADKAIVAVGDSGCFMELLFQLERFETFYVHFLT